MLEADALEAMAEAFVAAWPAASSAIYGAAVPFSLTNQRPASIDTSKPFAWHSFVTGLSDEQITMGAHPRFEHGGLVVVKIWTPVNAPAPLGGERLARLLAGAVRGIYQSQQFGGAPGVEPVTLGACSSRGAVEGAWYAVTTQHPYVFYEQT